MRHSAYDTEDWVNTFIYGLLGCMCLGVLGTVLYFLVTQLQIFCIVVGSAFGLVISIYSVGWLIVNRDKFLTIIEKENKELEPDHEVYRLTYTNPVLNGLAKFEQKYGMHTTHFMYLVSQECIPEQMDNLDYLEWVSFVNELPSLTNEKENTNGRQEI